MSICHIETLEFSVYSDFQSGRIKLAIYPKIPLDSMVFNVKEAFKNRIIEKNQKFVQPIFFHIFDSFRFWYALN